MAIRPKSEIAGAVRRRTRPDPSNEASLPASDKDDVEVGYGRPPKRTQFQKGQSGNPKGRPKGARGLKNIVDAQLNEVISYRMNGRATKGTTLELIVRQLSQKAMGGDLRAAEKVLKLVHQYLEDADDEKLREALTPREIDERDKALLADLLPFLQSTEEGQS